MLYRAVFFYLGLSLLQHVLAQCPSLSHNYTANIVTADGWKQSLVANNLTKPRGMTLDSKGNLLVVDVGVGVVGYKIVDNPDGGACLGEYMVIVSNKDLSHGIALSKDGSTLYASTKNDVFSWPYDPDTRTAAAYVKTIITKMEGKESITRTLFVHGDYIMVSVGPQDKLDTGATDINTGRSAVKFFSLSDTNVRTVPYDYPEEGQVLGWGLRNSVGLTVNPKTSDIWTVENSVDSFKRRGKEVGQDNPGEELNYHGKADEIFSNGSYVAPNYGFPFCAAIWDVQSLPDNNGLDTGEQIQLEDTIVSGNRPTDTDCQDPNKFVAPRLTFQAHMAPLDCTFDYFGGDPNAGGDGSLWVSFHGSRHRDIPVGYKLSKIPFDPATGQPLSGPGEKNNYEDIMWNADTMKCMKNGCFRPVGVVVDSKGRVWMGSDSSKELFVLWGDRKDKTSTEPSGAGRMAAVGVIGEVMWAVLVGAWLV